MSILAPIAVPDVEPIQTETTDLVGRAAALVISSVTEYQYGAEMLKAAKTIQANIVAEFKDSKQKAHEAHRAVCDLETKLIAPLKTAEAVIKSKLAEYTEAEERKRREEEQRLREIARKQEEERRLAEAILLEDDGDTEAAEAVIDAPVIAPVIQLAPAPKVDGISYRTLYRGEVVNAVEFLQWLIAHPDRIREVIDFKASGLNNLAKSIGSSVEVPGLRVTSEKSVASGRS